MHVSLSALESALRFAEELACTDDPADLGRRALPGLDRLVRADLLSYNELDLGPGHLSYWTYPEDIVFSPEIAAAFEAHVHENPLVSHMQTTGDGSPMMISDFLSRERFHRLGVYTEFYRHVPVEHQIAIGLPASEGRVVAIALNRARGPDFTEDDRDLLAVLRAPLVRAMSRARSRYRARQALSGPDGDVSGLTERELELLELVATGHTNAAIARMLQISPRTVANHLDHIYRKLEVSSRAAAVYRAVNEGLVAPADPPAPRSKLPPKRLPRAARLRRSPRGPHYSSASRRGGYSRDLSDRILRQAGGLHRHLLSSARLLRTPEAGSREATGTIDHFGI